MTLVKNASAPIPVVVGIDVEPDPRLTDPQRPEPWRGFERLYPFFMELRSQLASHSGTQPQFSWFFRLDPQVAGTYGDPAWPLKHYERQVAGLLAAGDEVGVHTHAYRWAPGRGTWIVDEADPEWIDQCLGSSFQAFAGFFHRPCRVHKTGDRWLSNAAVATLEALGARVDLTLEPGVRSPLTSHEVHTGSPIDCTHVSRRAYRPAPDDFRTPDPTGERRVWMLPLSTGRVPWYMQFPRRLYHRLRPAHGAPGDESSHVTVTLRPGFRPYLFRALVEQLLAGGDTAHLALNFRSSDGIEPAQVRRIAANLTGLLSHPLAARLRFVGAQAGLGILESAPASHK